MESNATSIIIKFEDGTEKEIKKGIAAEIENDTMHVDMINFKKFDIVRLAYGMVSTVQQLGLTDVLAAYSEGVPLPDSEDELE